MLLTFISSIKFITPSNLSKLLNICLYIFSRALVITPIISHLHLFWGGDKICDHVSRVPCFLLSHFVLMTIFEHQSGWKKYNFSHPEVQTFLKWWIGLDWLSGTGVSTALGNVRRPKLFLTKPPLVGQDGYSLEMIGKNANKNMCLIWLGLANVHCPILSDLPPEMKNKIISRWITAPDQAIIFGL